MSKQQYLWMQGLIAAWRQQVEQADQKDPGPSLQGVYAKAGTFSNSPTSAANDPLRAALCVLFVIWW